MTIAHNLITIGIFILPAIFVFSVEGFLNPFAYWNTAPILLAWFILRDTDEGEFKIPLAGTLAFSILTVGFIVLIHMAWFFNWGDTATGSSTSGLIFIFIPIYALIAGVAGLLLGWGGHKLIQIIRKS